MAVDVDQTTTALPSVMALGANIRPRPIHGISALLLPYQPDGRPDWDAFAAHLQRTAAAGLTPSVNMDTGYVHLLSDAERAQVLRLTRETLGGGDFVAGAFVQGQSGNLVTNYCRQAEQIRAHGGMPIIFQSTALISLPEGEIARVYAAVAERLGPLLGFELGQMFAPFGRIYSIELFTDLLQIPGLLGIKHSSLDRAQEWQRLALRDRLRPDFRIYTGNDLGIDMIMWGSDYLLGLSSFAPEAFGLRDRLWAAGDARFYALNDVLQYLGAFGFRAPVPAYRHSAAQFLQLRGQIPNARDPGHG